MPQRKRRKCLQHAERYARFTLAVGAELVGMARSTLCEALQKLRRVGLISKIWRPMHEIKRFGPVYVDGPRLSVAYKKHERTRSRPWFWQNRKRGTQAAKSGNAFKITLPKNSFSDSEIIFNVIDEIGQRQSMASSRIASR
jgi:hypothetical protein